MYVIRNGKIVTPEAIVTDHDLIVNGAVISGILPSERNGHHAGHSVIDARGGYVIPGLIDIHSDYIEHIAAPRPTSVMDFRLALRVAERELVTHGVTTMFHSLSLYNFTDFMPSPLRSPENTRKLIDLIAVIHENEHLIHHRFHARFEIDNLDRVAELESYIRDGRVHLISFMDHTPGQGQYRNLEMYRKTLIGYRNLSDVEVDRIIVRSQAREKLTIDAIADLARLAAEHGIAVASHDDDTFDKLQLVRGFGATISEFPVTLEVAEQARKLGMHTIAGAPNVLLGGSHSGNLSAAEAVRAGAVDVLCSDYYPAALLRAAFHLHRSFGLDLVEMIRLVTINPARAVLIDDFTGSLEFGKRADVLTVEILEDGSPAVTNALVNGEHVFAGTYRRKGTHKWTG